MRKSKDPSHRALGALQRPGSTAGVKPLALGQRSVSTPSLQRRPDATFLDKRGGLGQSASAGSLAPLGPRGQLPRLSTPSSISLRPVCSTNAFAAVEEPTLGSLAGMPSSPATGNSLNGGGVRKPTGSAAREDLCSSAKAGTDKWAVVPDAGRHAVDDESTSCSFTPMKLGMFHSLEMEPKPAGPPPLTDVENIVFDAIVCGELQETEKLLKEHGAAILSSPGGGGITSTAILYAASSGRTEMCELLVRVAGPKVLTATDISGRDAARFAKDAGHQDLASRLESLAPRVATASAEPVGVDGALASPPSGNWVASFNR